jgi:hypothetical protein
LVTFQVADRYAAPAVGGADQGGEYEFHGGFFVGEPGDHFGASAFFGEAALGQVGGARSDAVAHWYPVDGQQRVEVVGEAGDGRQVFPAVGVDEPVRGRSGRV